MVRQLARLGGLLERVGLENSPEKLKETLVAGAQVGATSRPRPWGLSFRGHDIGGVLPPRDTPDTDLILPRPDPDSGYASKDRV